MRRFWTARDRLSLQLHAARSCAPKRACHLRERLDIEWRNLKDLVEAPPTELASRAG